MANGSWCGAWLDTAAADHIFFVRDPSTVRMAQTVLHEAGHVLFDHPGSPIPADVELDGLDRAEVRRARGRTGFADRAELEAEAFASAMLRASLARRGTDLKLASDPRATLLEVRLG